jgi:hypothetical protein
MRALFLAASVPIAGRGDYYKTADPMLIQAAVQALITVALGRRLIVWGGHPGITPMLWAAAEAMGVPYENAVHLYQSRFFEGRYPEENARFKNVTYIDAVDGDAERSLTHMRTEMLRRHDYSGALFVGGMEGTVEEWKLFAQLHGNKPMVPLGSTGGAALQIAKSIPNVSAMLTDSIDYVGLIHSLLHIGPLEKRLGANG